MTDRLVEQLRLGITPQSCEADSVTFVRCGRGDCKCEATLMEAAANEIERLREIVRAGNSAANSG